MDPISLIGWNKSDIIVPVFRQFSPAILAAVEIRYRDNSSVFDRSFLGPTAPGVHKTGVTLASAVVASTVWLKEGALRRCAARGKWRSCATPGKDAQATSELSGLSRIFIARPPRRRFESCPQ